MPIVIKEIRVRTTVESKTSETHLSKEVIAALKRSIVEEITSTGYAQNKQLTKDR